MNTENVTRFSYKGNDYTILADTVSNGGLGEWIGYIRQLAAIDEKDTCVVTILDERAGEDGRYHEEVMCALPKCKMAEYIDRKQFLRIDIRLQWTENLKIQ